MDPCHSILKPKIVMRALSAPIKKNQKSYFLGNVKCSFIRNVILKETKHTGLHKIHLKSIKN